MTQQIRFFQGETFHQEEGDSVEFKEMASRKPVNTIVNHAEEYVLGFLNAQIEGDLYLGINDSGIIQGVTLNRNDRDEIHRNIPNKLRSTDPPIPHEHYKVIVYDVFNSDQEPIEDLCVVQIHISKTEEKDIYRTSGGSVYLKKGSSCMKLTTEEIAKEYKRRAQIHLQNKADELDKSLEKSPNNRDILEKRAEVAKFMGDIDSMDKMYRKLLELNPNNPEIRIEYATAHKSIGDLEGALSILNDAIQLDINDFSILKSRGLMLQGLDRWNEALQSYQQALKQNPDDYTTLTQIGVTFRQLEKYGESIQFLNYALSKCPGYRLAKYEKKKTYYEIFKGGIGIKNIPKVK
jgi:tetratricopeptide (TPR) repeat protein